MIRIAFTAEAIAQLHYERYHHPHPRVQQRMEALLLKAKGLPHATIADCVGVCENTLRSYFMAYQDGGIAALKQIHFYQPTSEQALLGVARSIHQSWNDALARRTWRR